MTSRSPPPKASVLSTPRGLRPRRCPWGHPAPPPTSSLTRKCARVGHGFAPDCVTIVASRERRLQSRGDSALLQTGDGARLVGRGEARAVARRRAGRARCVVAGRHRPGRSRRGRPCACEGSFSRARCGDRAHDEPRCRGVRRRCRCRSRAGRSLVPLRLTSSDVLDTALSLRFRRQAPSSCEGIEHAFGDGRAPRGRASRHADDRPYARCPRRADDLRAQARGLGLPARARP